MDQCGCQRLRWSVILEGDDEGEGELGCVVLASSVGVAAQLPVVGQLRVGALDFPAQSQRRVGGLGGAWGGGRSFRRPQQVGDADAGCAAAHVSAPAAAVEVDGVDVVVQFVSFDLAHGGLEQHDVVAIRSGCGPRRRDTAAVSGQRPLPAQLERVDGLFWSPPRRRAPCGLSRRRPRRRATGP